MTSKLTAPDLLALLEVRHSKDVFLTEVKDGPTHGASHRRMDAWGMRRSYTNPMMWGYEIKVARQDFLRDDKWRDAYLPNCNEFYFVAPADLIDPRELPDEAGLIVASRNGTRLYTKKKAPHRGIDFPEGVAIYLLMSRADFVDERYNETNEDYWRNWLRLKKERRDLGRAVSLGLRGHVERVEAENRKLKRRYDTYDSLMATLEALGVRDPASMLAWKAQQTASRLIHDLRTDLADWGFKGSVRDARRGLGRIAEWIEALEGKS